MKYCHSLNNLSIASLSDALDSLDIEGVLVGLKLLSGSRFIGTAFTVQYQKYINKPSDFKMAANYIDKVPSGSVVIIDNDGRDDCSTWGGLLTQVAVNKNIAGSVINGSARDLNVIQSLNYSLATKHIIPRSGKNRVQMTSTQQTLMIGLVNIKPGDVIVGDVDGVIVLPLEFLSEIIKRAEQIEINEAKILESLNQNISLKMARQKFNYAKPWL